MPGKEFLQKIRNFNIFIDQWSKEFSEPVNLSEEEVKDYIERLKARPLSIGTFYTVASTVSNKIPYHINTQDYLPIHHGFLDADALFNLIHPEYIEEYFSWGRVVYIYVAKQIKDNNVDPFEIAFSFRFPLKIKDGRYYWVKRLSFPLQIDQHRNLITYVNEYTILTRFDESDKREAIVGEMWGKSLIDDRLTRELRKEKLNHGALIFTPTERQILDQFFLRPDSTIKDIALALGKNINTIEQHNKKIIAKVKPNFPSFAAMKRIKVKQIAQFLYSHGYLDGTYQTPSHLLP